jgi:hypothetical protein
MDEMLLSKHLAALRTPKKLAQVKVKNIMKTDDLPEVSQKRGDLAFKIP